MANNKEDRIRSIMEHATGNVTDIYITLYKEFLKNQSAPLEEFRTILECPNIIENEGDVSLDISSDKKNELIYNYYGLISELSRFLASANPSAENYYQQLYNFVFVTPLIPDDDIIRGVVLEMISQHLPEIPYVQLRDPLYMSDDEYLQYSGFLSEQKTKAIYMLRRNLRTKTETISQIYDICEQLPDRTQRIVFWCNMIDLFKNPPEQE